MDDRVSPGPTTTCCDEMAAVSPLGTLAAAGANAAAPGGVFGGGPLGPTSAADTNAGSPVAATVTCRRLPLCGAVTWKYCHCPAGPKRTALSSGPDHSVVARKLWIQEGTNGGGPV